ncbi:MAG: FAD-dependent oxidoreductase, partial [Chloroflexi bacterium]|nr:FAD-dependent oxidoreductase [Chloroflexota bacterium]
MVVRSQTLSGAAIQDLEAHLLGQLIRPAHDDYDAARLTWNRTIDRYPALIVRAADAADVIRAVSFAAEYDVPLAVRSGGHSMAGDGSVDGGLVLDLGRMHGLSIDPARRVAWAQPGLTWGQYAERANTYGLATSAGDTASVGLGGLTLGGGIGWMVRKDGLTIDNLLSVELVTADGRLVRASEDEHPELFWALRGGGGNFGVATAFQFRLRPAGTILGGAVVYPATRAVLRGWADYAAQAPDELTSMAFIMPAPPAPFIPTEQVGKLVAVLGVCYVGDLEVGQQVVEPLRRLGKPIVDIRGPMPYPAVFALTEEAGRPGSHAVRSGYLQALEDDTLEAIVEQTARMPVPGGLVQLRALGGAMARVPVEATAFAHRDKPFMATVIGSVLEPADAGRQRGW